MGGEGTAKPCSNLGMEESQDHKGIHRAPEWQLEGTPRDICCKQEAHPCSLHPLLLLCGC